MRKRGLTEYMIALVAFVAWLLFEAGGRVFGWETYPVGYWQKVAFGILAMSIILGVAWLWLGASFPGLKKELDPDQIELFKLTAWEKLKLAFGFFALYALGAVLLASLY
jgi:hypothetical protein